MPYIHYIPSSIVNPTHRVSIHLAGCGGTGSQVLTCLAKMNHALASLGHPGLNVIAYDDDVVSEANMGRQLFSPAELGLHKSVALITRFNRFFGTDWEAMPQKLDEEGLGHITEGSILITCVDTGIARKNIFETCRNKFEYWMDYGNSVKSGQMILGTIGNEIRQPDFENSVEQTIGELPNVLDLFPQVAEDSGDDGPSCSMADALSKQDLFINSSLAHMGTNLLWEMFRTGKIHKHGFLMNLQEATTTPIKIDPDFWKRISKKS